VFHTVVSTREITIATMTSPAAIDAGIPGVTVLLLIALPVPTAPNPTATMSPPQGERGKTRMQ
jgi:hypothetical protein